MASKTVVERSLPILRGRGQCSDERLALLRLGKRVVYVTRPFPIPPAPSFCQVSRPILDPPLLLSFSHLHCCNINLP